MECTLPCVVSVAYSSYSCDIHTHSPSEEDDTTTARYYYYCSSLLPFTTDGLHPVATRSQDLLSRQEQGSWKLKNLETSWFSLHYRLLLSAHTTKRMTSNQTQHNWCTTWLHPPYHALYVCPVLSNTSSLKPATKIKLNDTEQNCSLIWKRFVEDSIERLIQTAA